MATSEDDGTVSLLRSSYEIAWQEYHGLPGPTPDEIMFGPDRLRSYIKAIANSGETDPVKIAKSALGMLREYEQIARSKMRLALRQQKSE